VYFCCICKSITVSETMLYKFRTFWVVPNTIRLFVSKRYCNMLVFNKAVPKYNFDLSVLNTVSKCNFIYLHLKFVFSSNCDLLV
jgi:hypothetical protein